MLDAKVPSSSTQVLLFQKEVHYRFESHAFTCAQQSQQVNM